MTNIVDIDMHELQECAFRNTKQMDSFIIRKLKNAGIPINYNGVIEKKGVLTCFDFTHLGIKQFRWEEGK